MPLLQDAGLDVEWRIMRGGDEFFSATKTIHNARQGSPRGLTDRQRDGFLRNQQLNAGELGIDVDRPLLTQVSSPRSPSSRRRGNG